MPTFGTPSVAGGASGGAATAITIARPADVQPGDVVVAALRGQRSSTTNDFTADGWTRLGVSADLPSVANRVNALLYRTVTADDPTSYVFAGPEADRVVGLVVRVVPDAVGLVEEVSASPYASPSLPAGVAVVDGLTLYLAGCEATVGNSTYPATIPDGVTEVAYAQSTLDESTTGSRTGVWLGYRVEPDEAIPAESFTWAAASSPAAIRVSTTGALPVGSSTATLDTVVGGSTVEAPASVMVGGTMRPIARVRTWTHGIETSTAAVAGGATWAHRGGSATLPEMSEHAYDTSAMLGFGALEFSCARTSDGVWFGLHDSTLDRTSGVTGGIDPSDLTWADLQASYALTLNAIDQPRPYYELTAFLDKYVDHVRIVDPKHAIGSTPEFLDILDAHGGPERTIVKFFGVGSGAAWLADSARAHGYKTWGYFYPADVESGALATYADRWDFLGMDHAAPQSAWDAVLAYGKPVVGHIAQTQAHYDAAIAKGATAVQCAGVEVITPIA